MTITITVDTTFKKLNDDPSYQRKPGGVGREREIVASVAITASTTYPTNGIILDFTAFGLNFTQVYLVDVIQGHGGFYTEFIPDIGNAAATGKLKFYGRDSGNDTTNSATGTVTCVSAVANTFADADITCATVLENTFATGTVICASAVAGDTVTFNGLLYTAVAGAKANDTEFSIDTGDNETATDLADSIDDDTRTGTSGDASATSSTDTVTITTTTAGTNGNAVLLASSNGTRLAVSAATLTGGVDADTVTVNGLVYTAVAGARADDTEFSIDTGDNETATDLAAAVNADTRSGTSGDVSATSSTDTVTVTTDVSGSGGNAITIISSDGTTLAVTGAGNFTGGVTADTVTVNGLVYTAVAGSKANDTEFSIDTGDNETATDLADSIDDDTRTGTLLDVSATETTNVVTITCTTTGSSGNAITLASSNGTRLAVSAATLTGGVGGDISAFQELEAGDTGIQGKTLKCIVRGI